MTLLPTLRRCDLRTRVAATVVAALGALAAAGGCASRPARPPSPLTASSPTRLASDVAKPTTSQSQPASSPGTAASLPASPVAAFASTSTGLPRCPATAMTLRPDALSPETGEHGFTVWITNNADPCVLIGYPSVRFLDAAGAPLPLTYHQGGRYTTSQRPREVELPTGGRAVVIVAKYRCDLGDRQVAVAAELTLPGSAGRPAQLPISGIAYCGANDPGDDVYVSPIEPDVGAASNLAG